ncbi:MAG: two-component system cell cycle sensor histidine kinase/response regulator CckA [Paracoccaceae bacterium]|jgi:two-component system cell cycle sensor histidine kinase/response regulator CckA
MFKSRLTLLGRYRGIETPDEGPTLTQLVSPRDRLQKITYHAFGRTAYLMILAACLAVVAAFVESPVYGLLLFGASGSLAILAIVMQLFTSVQVVRTGRATDGIAATIEFDAAPGFMTDGEGVILHQNVAARDRFGARSGDLLTRTMRDFFANPAAVLLKLRDLAHSTGSAREDIVTRRGHIRLAVHSAGDNVLLWRLEDLVDRGALDRSANASGLPMLSVSKDGSILFMNDAFRRVLGRREATLDAIFSDLPLRSEEEHVLKGKDGLVKARILTLPGTAEASEVFILPDAGPVDVAVERPVEAAVVSKSVLGQGDISTSSSDQLDEIPIAVLKMTREGALISSNRLARDLLGVDAVPGVSLAQLVEGLGRSVRDWLEDVAAGRTSKKPEVVRAKMSDQDVFLQITLNAVEQGGETVLVAVLADATELKTLEAQFVQSQKMQAIGQLAGGVAHDFNNLLTAITGHCDLLLLRHDQGDPDYGDLVQINQNANRAASLVGQLLAFSRKQNLQPQVLDLRDTLGDLTHLLNRLVGERITLSLSHDAGLEHMRADKRQLEQVLMNLVVNARDAMPEGGEIRISTEMFDCSSPVIRDRVIVPNGRYVVVKVSDDGVGIPPDKLPKIFEPFFTTKRTGEGTGLGLSTAYGIVKQSGGYIFVDSAVGTGTTFSLIFPVFSPPVSDVVPVKVVKQAAILEQGEGVVLLVEDEAPVRAFASRALRLRGYTVIEAENAEDALKTLEDVDLKIDVFVTDVIMPGMDGPSWVRLALKSRPLVKVVFVSGYAEESFADEQAAIPNSVFLPKPFSLNELTTVVHGQIH